MKFIHSSYFLFLFPASFYGSSFVSMPMKDDKDTTTIRFKFKTSRASSFLFLVAGRDDYCFLRMESGLIKVPLLYILWKKKMKTSFSFLSWVKDFSSSSYRFNTCKEKLFPSLSKQLRLLKTKSVSHWLARLTSLWRSSWHFTTADGINEKKPGGKNSKLWPLKRSTNLQFKLHHTNSQLAQRKEREREKSWDGQRSIGLANWKKSPAWLRTKTTSGGEERKCKKLEDEVSISISPGGIGKFIS